MTNSDKIFLQRGADIDRLLDIQYTINLYEKRLEETAPYHYREILGMGKWKHRQYINEKSLWYWRRRFDRIINSLKYYD